VSATTVPRPESKHLVRRYAVLAFTCVVAALGVFPHHLLFVVPLAASVTLLGLHRRVRLLVAGVSAGMLLLGLASLIGIA
jgi:hypothetical protein